METIKEAKHYLRANFDKGTACPCCGQYVKLYKRKLSSGMARFMIGLYLLTNSKGAVESRIYHKDDIADKVGLPRSSGSDYGVLRHFGLIQPHTGELTKGAKESGLWSLTQYGVDFVESRAMIQERVCIFDNKRTGFDGKGINISEALGSHFDYKELMEA